MSTNFTSNVLTSSRGGEFEFKQEIISRGMNIKRIGMERSHYYAELDEEVPKPGKLLYEGQMEIVASRVKIPREFFIQLLVIYLPKFGGSE